MFTGIIKGMGRVRGISGLGSVYKLSVEAEEIASGAAIGDSIAVNGVCLTLTAKERGVINFDVMGETIKRTTLGKLRPQDSVNLEGALKAGGPISGHFVTGHIDCVGRIRDVRRTAGDVSLEVVFPEGYEKLVVEKGSVALDGISLTIGKVSGNSVIVHIIPHTLKMTTLGAKKAGDEVNIEFDIIGKYIAKHAFS